MSRITFGGLASGLDTNHLIDQLLELERQPIKRKEKRIEGLEKKRDAWRDVNMRLRHLRESLQGLLARDNFQSMQAQSTDPSVVTARVGSKAEPSSYELQVNKLATQHTMAMETDIQTKMGKTAGEALELSGVFNIKDLTAEGETYKEIEIAATDTLNNIKNKINAADVGVVATIFAGHLVLKSDQFGADSEVVLNHVSGDNIMEELGVEEKIAAQNAEFTLNGFSFVRSSNAVDDIIDDVTFDLRKAAEGVPVQVEVGADLERAVEAMGVFVEQYNSVNDFIRDKMEQPDENSEGASRGLLQGDTTLMKIERTLRTMVNAPLSDSRYQDEEGEWQQKKYYSLASLGVTTVDKEGYLQFNEEALAAALRDDPESVFKVMHYEIKDEDGLGTEQYSGVAVDLDNYLNRLLVTGQDDQGRTLRPIAAQQEASVQRRIDEVYRRIEMREERLLRYEDRLIRQFTALERGIATMQAQSQEMENMIGQLAGFGKSN